MRKFFLIFFYKSVALGATIGLYYGYKVVAPQATKKRGEGMGNRISHIRKEKGITQTELAKRMNINRSHLSKVETGKAQPSTRLLERIAHELGVSMKDFFN